MFSYKLLGQKKPDLLSATATTTLIRLIAGEYQPFRQIYTATQPRQQRNAVRKETLYNKLANIKGRKVHNVLHEVANTGFILPKKVLLDCLKDLRKRGYYQQCLEILDWLDNGNYNHTSSEHALRIGLIYKLEGIEEVEKYFFSIPPEKREFKTFGALFSCYCTELDTDKTLALLQKMEVMNFEFNVLIYNNLMGMYMKLSQPEKVPALVEVMKERNIPLQSHTYSFWMQSYRMLNDSEGVERAFMEAQEQDTVRDEWVLYSICARALFETGQIHKAISVLKLLEDVLDSLDKPVRNGYHNLIRLSASTGKLELVTQAWNKLKSKFKSSYKLSYLSMLQALSDLDDIESLKAFFQDWESSCVIYDEKIPLVLIGAYLRHDMLEDAELLLKRVTEKVGHAVSDAHVLFMDYFFEKHQLDSSLQHLEAAIASTSKWKPNPEKIELFFQHFRETKDVDRATKLCQLLKRAHNP